jgi:hypothetical protein
VLFRWTVLATAEILHIEPKQTRTRTPSIKRCSRCGETGHDRRTCGRREKPKPFDPWSDLEWEDHVEARRLVVEFPDGMTLESVGYVLGVTRERVRQIESVAIRKLRNRIGLNPVLVVDGCMFALIECDRCGVYFRRDGRWRSCPECRGEAGSPQSLSIEEAEDDIWDRLEKVDVSDLAEYRGPRDWGPEDPETCYQLAAEDAASSDGFGGDQEW